MPPPCYEMRRKSKSISCCFVLCNKAWSEKFQTSSEDVLGQRSTLKYFFLPFLFSTYVDCCKIYITKQNISKVMGARSKMKVTNIQKYEIVVDTRAKKGTGMMETIFERFDVKIFKILPKPLIPNQLQLQIWRYLTSPLNV